MLTNLPAVHPNSNDSCGAWWKGSPAGLEQIVLGFADSPPGQTSCLSADNALDVVAHEYTHGVTQAEGGLNSGGEAGGLDESIADIFGALVQAWADVSPTQTGTELRLRADTWTFAEDMYASGYWRSMCNPREHDPVNDKDYYDADFNDLLPNGDELYGSHQKATLTDLMFCLLSRGGPHPRPASGSTVSSIGIGMDRAIKIVYIARNALAQNADLADFRAEMEIAGNSLYGTTGTYAVQCAFAAIGIGAPPFSVSCQRDDVLFTNTTTGSIYSWQMNGMTAINTYTYGTLPAGYEVKGTGDFDNDAKTDLLLHNASTGASQLWLTRGASSPVVVPSSLPGTGWEFQTIGDFDGGGIADVLWKNTSTGALNVWQMNAGFLFPVVTGGTLTTETVAATADFNLDDRDDVVLTRTDGSGNLQVKIARAQDVATVGLQTPAQAITLNPTTPLSAADYRVIAAGDLSGDGVPDLVFQNGTSGNVKVWLMNSAANYTIASETSVATSLLTTAFGGVGYIDGDAKADLVWRLAPPSSKLKVWFMDGATITTSYTYTGNPSVPGTKLGIGQFN